MPELPEVETVVRGLIDTVLNKTIESADCRYPRINNENRRGWTQQIAGRKITQVNRRGKNILMHFDNEMTLWVHLKMTGHLYYLSADEPVGKHDLIVFKLKSDSNDLRFNDYRRFGRVRLVRTAEIPEMKGIKELGPEPLEINMDDFIALFSKSSRMIKPALLDQTFIAGLGNIYADESLYMSRIHPKKLTNRISRRKLVLLHENIQKILKRSISLMGTSFDSYAGVNGQPGGFQKYLLAYGREGEPCGICGAKIRREKIGSRSAHYCPSCQRL